MGCIMMLYYEWSNLKTASLCQYNFAPDHIRSPWFWLTGWGCRWGGAPLFSSRPSFAYLVSLALTKPRWAVVPTFRMWHSSGEKKWVSKGPRESLIWGCPPMVNTQLCTPWPSFYAKSCNSFEDSLCARDKWLKIRENEFWLEGSEGE